MAATKTRSLAAALRSVREEVPELQKDSINPHHGKKHISLDSLLVQILPVLHRHDVLLMQSPSNIDGQPALTTALVHVPSEQSIDETMPLILDKNNPGGHGSAITYARRYAVLSLLGLVADGDARGHPHP
jgi:hypothetical protein